MTKNLRRTINKCILCGKFSKIEIKNTTLLFKNNVPIIVVICDGCFLMIRRSNKDNFIKLIEKSGYFYEKK